MHAHGTWAAPGVVEGWAILPDLARQLPRESTACVWLGVPAAVLEARARVGAEEAVARRCLEALGHAWAGTR